MGVLDQIIQMRSQGIPDQQIIDNLQQQGITPKQISDALSQAQIKNAVTSSPGDYQGSETMEPSIMQQEYSPQQAYQNPEDNQQGYQNTQQAYYPQEEYQQSSYPMADNSQGYDQGYSQQSVGISTDTIIEISEQVFSEKIKKLQKQSEDLNTSKALTESKLENLSERLKRIEGVIDRLQTSILDKVGEYGQNLGSIKKEMEMVEDSFQKMLSSKVKEKTAKSSSHEHPTEHTKEHKKSSKKK